MHLPSQAGVCWDLNSDLHVVGYLIAWWHPETVLEKLTFNQGVETVISWQEPVIEYVEDPEYG